MNIYEIVDNLHQFGVNNIKLNEPLKNHTNIKIGGPAEIFVEVDSKKQLRSCINFFNSIKYKYFILGNGTNTLANDSGYKGAVICLKGLKKYKLSKDGIYAQAGVGLFQLNKLCRKFGLGGLEFSYGIPGSVGGAVCMNAGSYGYNLGDFIDYVCVLKNGRFKNISAKNMHFDYRTSIIQKSDLIVIGAKFKLAKSDGQQIEDLQNSYFQKRLQTQPYTEPSLGSVFKREEGQLPISKLIDDLGLKGFKIGGACVSEKHAGFIVNKHLATCQDFVKLVNYVQNKVKSVYGFVPKLEIKILEN